MNSRLKKWGVIFFALIFPQGLWAQEQPQTSPVVTAKPSATGTPACDPDIIYVVNRCSAVDVYRLIRTQEDWEQYVGGDDFLFPAPADFTNQMLVIIPYFPTPGQIPTRLAVSSACVLQNRIEVKCYLMEDKPFERPERPGSGHHHGGQSKVLGVLLPKSSLPVTVLR